MVDNQPSKFSKIMIYTIGTAVTAVCTYLPITSFAGNCDDSGFNEIKDRLNSWSRSPEYQGQCNIKLTTLTHKQTRARLSDLQIKAREIDKEAEFIKDRLEDYWFLDAQPRSK